MFLYIFSPFQINGGTKIQNIINFMKTELNKNPKFSALVYATGGGIQKAVTCVEIIKRDFKLSQQTEICYEK